MYIPESENKVNGVLVWQQTRHVGSHRRHGEGSEGGILYNHRFRWQGRGEISESNVGII